MTRFCACPCKRPLLGRPERVKYIDHRHRQRAYEQRRAVELRSAGFPALLSKKLAQTPNPTKNRQADAPDQTTRVKRRSSGAQISYCKAVLALALDYQREGKPWIGAVAKAERVLQQALPVRQRAQLHAREQTHKRKAA